MPRPVIRLLDPKVANQIAAGEVVERPAAAAKELLENALDAGARRVTLDFSRGGKALLAVEDDGHGMTPDQAELALQRHATSKIADAADLGRIRSFGFRGEALPSIASVSRFTLRTRAEGAEAGCEILVNAGRTVHVREHGMAVGTRIEVANLFHPVPARLKFLKSDDTEAAHIVRMVRLYAVAHPEVGFLLREDGREVFRSPGNVPVAERVRVIWGKSVADELVPLPAAEGPGMGVSGLLGKPGVSRSTRQDIVTVVNGRPVDSRALTYALVEAYHTLIPKGRFPLAFLFLEIDPAAIDVNVHPAKREIRFRDEAKVRAFVMGSVLAALRGQPEVGSPLPAAPAVELAEAPRASDRAAPASPAVAPAAPSIADSPVASSPQAAAPPGAPLRLAWRLVGRLRGDRAAFETPSGLVVLDLGSAHQRVLFESIVAGISSDHPVSQPLLLPIPLELDPLPAAVLAEQSAFLSAAGFGLEPYGRNFWRVAALPTWLEPGEAEAFLRDLLSEMARREGDFARAHLAAEGLARLAVRRARYRTDTLSDAELLDLVRRLFLTTQPGVDPLGRRTYFELGETDLDRRLGRG
ncbi:MAG: DNA mismatch repair endonuclease MutL [Opitutia bacterium]